MTIEVVCPWSIWGIQVQLFVLCADAANTVLPPFCILNGEDPMAYLRSTQHVGVFCTLPKLALMRGSLISHHLSGVVWISCSLVHELNGTFSGQAN